MRKNLVLLGMMAVGKTTLGKIVAKKQGLEFIDIDANIEVKYSMKISEIFKKKGEKFFRINEEKEVLNSLKKKNCVIALGGGAFINKIIRNNVLGNAISIWLDIDLITLNKRIKWNKNRPLLNKENNEKKIRKIKIILIIKFLLIMFLRALGCNLSCIIVQLYLHSKNKT